MLAHHRLVLVVFALALPACPEPPPGTDASVDGAPDLPHGYVRWSSVACPAAFDGSTGPAGAGCTRPTPHSSVTGLTTPSNAMLLSCAAMVQTDGGATVVIAGFNGSETFNPAMWPGSLELRGLMSAATTSPTTVGQQVTACEVRLHEGTHTAVGHCGGECTVTITQYYPNEGTVSGTVRCGAMADDSTPPVYRNLVNGQGVPMTTGDFALTGCTAP